MKKIMLITGILCFFIISTSDSLFAAPKKIRYNKSIMDRQTPLNDLTDFFATIGKPNLEAKIIKKNRRTQRKKWRIQQEKKRERAELKKLMKQQQKIVMDKIDARNQARYKNSLR